MTTTWWDEPQKFRLSSIKLKTVGAHPASNMLNAATKLATERCGVVRMTATVYRLACHQHTGAPTDRGAR